MLTVWGLLASGSAAADLLPAPADPPQAAPSSTTSSAADAAPPAPQPQTSWASPAERTAAPQAQAPAPTGPAAAGGGAYPPPWGWSPAPHPPRRWRPPPPTVCHWYGWQNLLAYLGADVALVGSMFLAGYTGQGEAIIPAIVLRASAGSIVHFAHGQIGRGFGALGLVGGGAGGGLLLGLTLGALASTGCRGEMCDFGAMAIGGAVGLAAGTAIGTAIDVGVLSYEQVPADSAAVPRATLGCGAAPLGAGAGVGCLGTF